MIDLNSSSIFSDRINHYIDKGILNEPKYPRNYLGGSRIGEECERALQYELFNTPKDKDFDAKTLRIFKRGFWVEDAMRGWLRGGGFSITKTQNGISVFDGMVRGHEDGIFTEGPKDLGPYPALWECKGINEKGWKELLKNKLKKQYQTYYSQCQFYMGHINLERTLFNAVNMNTMEIYWEEIKFDQDEFDMLNAKAKRIILACTNQELLPRLTNDPTYFKCLWCSWNIRCHA